MEGDPLLVHAEKQFINQSEKLIIMADSSKFTTRKNIIICHLEKVDTVPTDEHFDDDSFKMLSDAGVEFIIAG